MRFVMGILAASVLAVLLGTGGARAEEARNYADLIVFRQSFAAEAPVWVAFEKNEVALGPDAKKRLDRQAAWIAGHKGVRVRVYGIAAKTGYAPRNMAVAMKRANAVVRYLASRGVDPARLDAVVLLGNAPRPRFSNVEASTVTEVSGLPGLASGVAGTTS